MGVGLCSLPCVIAIGNHFNKYLNLAYGIYNSTIGLGCVFFPPMVSACIEYYGWRGAMLILGGCCLNFLLAAASLRPVDTARGLPDESDDVDKESADDKARHDSGHHSLNTSDSMVSLATLEPLVVVEAVSPHRETGVDDRNTHKSCVLLNRSHFRLDIMSQSALGIGSLATMRTNQRHIRSRCRRECEDGIHSGLDIPSGSRIYTGVRKHESVCDIRAKAKHSFDTRFSQSHGVLPQTPHDCSTKFNFPDTPVFLKKALVMSTDDPAILGLSLHTVATEPESSHASQLLALRRDSQFFDTQVIEEMEEKTTWRRMFNIGLLGLCASQFLFSIGMSITYLHLPVYTISQGTSAMQASSLISVIGITNVATRFLVGAATSHKSVDDGVVYIIMSIIAGICLCMAEPMCAHFSTQLLFAGLFGFFANGYVSVAGPLTIKYVGLNYLGPAYSAEMVLSGIAFFIGPPLAGRRYYLIVISARHTICVGVNWLYLALNLESKYVTKLTFYLLRSPV